jgi:hypothetical protein
MIFPQQFCRAVNNTDGAFMTGFSAEAAAVTFFRVHADYVSKHFPFLSYLSGFSVFVVGARLGSGQPPGAQGIEGVAKQAAPQAGPERQRSPVKPGFSRAGRPVKNAPNNIQIVKPVFAIMKLH